MITTTKKGDVTDLVTNYYYDGRERLVKQGRVSDSGENVSTYRYDYLDNAVSQTGYDGAVTAYAYNALGQVRSATNANGETTSYAYDGLGNVTATTNALGDTTYTRYDALGRLIKKDSPQGGGVFATTRYYYDGSGKPDKDRRSGRLCHKKLLHLPGLCLCRGAGDL